jgi:hypothetical protein
MSNTLSDIRAALETALAAAVGAWPVAYENVAFTKPADGKYLQARILPAQPVNYAGNAGFTKYHGLFNVMVIIPACNSAEGGPGNAEAQAAAIMAYFARGTAFTAGTATVRIGESPYPAVATQTDDDYSLPVWIPWFCHI